MTWRIPNMVPEITDADRAAVQATLLDGYACGGPVVQQLEERFAELVGVAHAVAVSSGTAALWLAMKGCLVGSDTYLCTSDMTFMATAAPAEHLGAEVQLADCTDKTWQLDLNCLPGRPLHVLVLPHLWGGMAREDLAVADCRRRGAFLVVDACQALGATLHGQQPGSWADVACWSFNGNKLVTGGGGGMLTTNDREIAASARYLANQAKDDGSRWVHHQAGWNFRMSAMQAALALSQLSRWGEYVKAKWELHQRYLNAFESTPLSPRDITPEVSPSMWASTWLLDGETERLIGGLRAAGIEARRPFAPLSWQPPFHDCSLGQLDTTVHQAEHVHTHGVLLPCSVGLTNDDQNLVIEAVKEALQ